MPWGKCVPVSNKKLIGLCGTQYHGHPKGCHNFCTRPSCPPTMQSLSICLDDFYLIWIKYPIGTHVRDKLKVHPDWSIYQARNILYWQATARKILQKVVDKFLVLHSDYRVLGPKEHLDSWAIDMTATIAQFGIVLNWGVDWALQEYTYVLRYAGIPIEKAGARRMRRLAKQFPIVYGDRSMFKECVSCYYRPCLVHMKNNPSLYVNQQIGNLKIESITASGDWLVRCDCGRRKVIPKHRPFCTGFGCRCQRQPGPCPQQAIVGP